MGALKPAIGWLLGGIGALALGLLATQMPPARVGDLAPVMLCVGAGLLVAGLVRWRFPALCEVAPAGCAGATTGRCSWRWARTWSRSW